MDASLANKLLSNPLLFIHLGSALSAQVHRLSSSMKKNTYATLFIVISGLLCWVGLPWWSVVPLAAVAGFFISPSVAGAFLAGFAGGALLWYGSAMWYNILNAGLFAAQIGEVFAGLKNWQLLTITATVGGLLSGMGAMTGCLLREVFIPSKPHHRNAYPRRRKR